MKKNTFLKSSFYFLLILKTFALDAKTMDPYLMIDLYPHLNAHQNKILGIYNFYPESLTVKDFEEGEAAAKTQEEVMWYSELHIDLIKTFKKNENEDSPLLSAQFFREGFVYHHAKKRYEEAAFCVTKLLDWLNSIQEAPTQNDYQNAAQAHYDLWRVKKQVEALKKANIYLVRSLRLLKDTTPDGLFDLRESIASGLDSLEVKNRPNQRSNKEFPASKSVQNTGLTGIQYQVPVEIHIPMGIHKTGILVYKRDRTGDILILKQTEMMIIKGGPIEKTLFTKLLFIEDENQRTYISFDPSNKILVYIEKNTPIKNLRPPESKYLMLELMKKFDVCFVDQLEGKTIQFEATPKTIKIEDTSYPLAKIIL